MEEEDNGNLNTIDFISFSITGNATLETLTETRFNMGGMSSSTRGVWEVINLSDVIDYVTIEQ